MRSKYIFLKKFLLKNVKAPGFFLKSKKLTKKKWFFLKIQPEKFFEILTLNFQYQVKEFFQVQNQQISLSKVHFFILKTKKLKKILYSLISLLKKSNKFYQLKFKNLVERRLIFILLHSQFFHRIKIAATAIKRGDILVNGKKIFSVNFLVRINSIISLTGQSRLFVFEKIKYQKILLEEKNLINSLILRKFKRNLQFYSFFQKNLIEIFLLKYLTNSLFFKHITYVNLVPFYIPNFLIVDFKSLSCFVKNPMDKKTSELYPVVLSFLNLWKLRL